MRVLLNAAPDERTLVEYLLGRLAEPQRLAIEERLLTEETFEEELLATAEDLIDVYLKGALSAEDRACFESHFLAIPRHQRQLAFLKDLGSAVDQVARSDDAAAEQRPASSPEGPTRPEPAIATHGSRRTASMLWIGLAAALVAVALAATLRVGSPQPGRATVAGGASVAGPSLAVLPFVDVSPAKDQEYFADGLSEELLNALARTPRLRVAARTSSFQFKGKTHDIGMAGRRLDVGAILEGSVRRADDRLHVSARLVNVSDGRPLWSATYDRDPDQILAVQDDIARAVTNAMNVTTPDVSRPPALERGSSAAAYVLYFQGKYFALRRTDEQLQRAIEHYERALQLDPEFAPAWVGLADAHASRAGRAYVPAEEGYSQARRALERALALDPEFADAHAVMGSVRRGYDWDWAGADAACKRAVALEPGNARALQCAARVAGTLGRLEEAIELYKRILRIDPLSVNVRFLLGGMALTAGRLGEAEAAFRELLELNPSYPGGHFGLGLTHLIRSQPEAALEEMEQEAESLWLRQGLALAYAALGRRDEADAALARLLEKDQNEAAIQIASVYAFRGEADEAFRWLERAYAQRDPGLADLKGYPLFKSIETDPRYRALLEKLRLPL